jgi:hypothetical protein
MGRKSKPRTLMPCGKLRERKKLACFRENWEERGERREERLW